MTKKITLLSLFIVLISCNIENKKHNIFPAVWMSMHKAEADDDMFADLKKHGVTAVEEYHNTIRIDSNYLSMLRRHGLKLIIDLGEPHEKAWEMPDTTCERAVFVGGSYQGKAIDRYRFAFSAKPHRIIIGTPMYDPEHCYGDTLGRYFPDCRAVKAEVIVKQKDYDGKQHIHIYPAHIRPLGQYDWQMDFDLSNTDGDTNNVLLCVYWTSRGKHWLMQDAATVFAETTRNFVVRNIENQIAYYSSINNGIFPSDVIIAARYGDECFAITGHANCAACSYPLYDYSPSAIEHFTRTYPGMEYPRGKNFTDMFGREAYALWMYEYHRACAELLGLVKMTITEKCGYDILLLRNITRMYIFDPINDHDGSGLDQLIQALDIAHIDPYPIKNFGYHEDLISIEMSYISGLARRHGKYIVPWLQAHTYGSGSGALVHPTPAQIEKMVNQHLTYHPDGLMWLGYGQHMTFPHGNAESWATAGKIHNMFIKNKQNKVKASCAVIRPYTVRALRDMDSLHCTDMLLTNGIILQLVAKGIVYDAFEPLRNSELPTKELAKYRLIFATTGSMTKEALQIFTRTRIPAIIFCHGADHFLPFAEASAISKYRGAENNIQAFDNQGHLLPIRQTDLYDTPTATRVLLRYHKKSIVWQKDNLLFVSCIPDMQHDDFFHWLWGIIENSKPKAI